MADGTAPEGAERGPSALLVSACLLGVECNHRGAASPRSAVQALAATHDLIPVCPEVEGGLPVPRAAAERLADGRVVTEAGDDVTGHYRRGAAAAVALAHEHRVAGAVLKARSPSCGCHQVYDGTFTRTLVDGEGLTAAALRAAGFPVVSEEDLVSGGAPGAELPAERARPDR